MNSRGEVLLMECQAPNGPPSGGSAYPRSLPAWLPFLWARVLFAGASPPLPGPCRPRALLLLVVLPAALLYPCLGFALFEPDESRYAEIPREMLQRGELVVPRLQGEPYLDKPPLLYWLVAAGYRLFGVSAASARLVPALALHGCVLLVYLLGRRSLGEHAAFRGALLLGLAPGFSSMGRLLLLDGLLTFWATLALFSAFEALRGRRLRWGWWLLAAAACGLGVLTKGPIALVLLLPPLGLYRWLTGQGVRPGRVAWGAFLLVLAGVALPWFVALSVRIPAFVSYFFWEQNVLRFLTPAEHVRGVWFYVPVLLMALLPGTLLVVPLVRFLLSGEPAVAARRPAELGFVLLAGGWCVLFFTLSACKLPTYILPALPPLALALGYFLAHGPWSRSRWLPAGAGLAFVLLALAHLVVVPRYAAYRSPLHRPEEVRRLCADPGQTVVCYPRPCDSVAFYLGRDDLRNYRSKDIEDLRRLVRTRPRTVILCTHRHSFRGLCQLLPPEMCVTRAVHLGLEDLPGVPRWLMQPLARLMGETALGLCDLAVVERRPAEAGPRPLPTGVLTSGAAR
jgi:4-amino-4-deoxy-L-arabinose transferase-like glycosyltransferase